MSLEENKVVARRLYEEVITGGNEHVIPEILTEDYRLNMAGNPEPMDLAGVSQFIATFRTAFPDLSDSPEDMVAEGTKVAVRGVMRGTHQGDFMGIPATGKHVTASWIAILEMQDGRIREVWLSFDMLGMMQQLGVVPAPEGAPA